MPGLSESQTAFLEKAINLARRIGPLYGLDWRLSAAAAVLESGWGESGLAREAHNYFGITATPRTPPAEVYVLTSSSGPRRFRRFADMEEAFHAYGRLLSRSSHYEAARRARAEMQQAFEHIHALMRQVELQAFVREMAPTYCPDDPDYDTKLFQIVDLIEGVQS
ncbi:glucosaminidase domain-containing protein [bacterium]|nr:glucosaminidase domain-containing protein [bacterium]